MQGGTQGAGVINKVMWKWLLHIKKSRVRLWKEDSQVLSSLITVKTIWIGARHKSQEINARILPVLACNIQMQRSYSAAANERLDMQGKDNNSSNTLQGPEDSSRILFEPMK
jgi:hypothetical protein